MKTKITPLLIVIYTYGTFAFLCADFDFRNWHWALRLIAVLITYGLISSYFTSLISSQDQDNY